MNWKFWQRKSRLQRENERLFNLADESHKLSESLFKRNQEYVERIEGLENKLDAAHQEIEHLRTAPKAPIQPQIRPTTELSLAEWRKHENLVASAANVLKHPDLRAMLDVLENEHPAKKGVVMGANLDQRAIWQAVGQGYQRFFDNLYALGQKPQAKKEVAETWADTNLTGGGK